MLERRPKLPVQQLIVLCKSIYYYFFSFSHETNRVIAICRFAEPVVLTSVLPYLVRLPSSVS